jgi:hypothetical protein
VALCRPKEGIKGRREEEDGNDDSGQAAHHDCHRAEADCDSGAEAVGRAQTSVSVRAIQTQETPSEDFCRNAILRRI